MGDIFPEKSVSGETLFSAANFPVTPAKATKSDAPLNKLANIYSVVLYIWAIHYNCGCFLWAKKQYNWRTLITFLTLPTFFDFVILKSTMILISIQRTYCTLYVCTGTLLYVLYVARATYLHYIAKAWPTYREVYRHYLHVPFSMYFFAQDFNHFSKIGPIYMTSFRVGLQLKNRKYMSTYFLERKSSPVGLSSPLFDPYFECTCTILF